MLGRNSKPSIQNNFIICNQIMKPVWGCSIESYGCASKTNMPCIQTRQTKIIREIICIETSARRFVRNEDLNVETVMFVRVK